MRLASLAAVIYATMIFEALRARANERAQLARGGLEPAGDVYQAMRFVYPLAFAAIVLEGLARQAPPPALVVSGVAVFAAGKVLKWWAIAALGASWTFRVIVIPAAPLVVGGPYRFVRHPNYVGVVGELVGASLVAGAPVSGPVSVAVFALLLVKRIRLEDRWLSTASKEHARSPHRGT